MSQSGSFGAGAIITPDQDNIIYVGKHGNDGNDGLTINKAKLTFTAAITAAAAGDAIWCFDDGAYVENLTFNDDIIIFGNGKEKRCYLL